jgi:hypothetical protein
VRRSDEDEGGDQVWLDGEMQAGECILLIDDGRDHDIEVRCRMAR